MRLALALLPFFSSAAFNQSDFALHNGDRVVFYGDSITEQSMYPNFIETLVHTRYPSLHVRFWNAGVGGDRVTGGWMGPIDPRLSRDLFRRRPTVVTIMLGMNDASYKPIDDGIFQAYKTGYEHIVQRIKAEAPNARVWLIQPSPYDDVTHAPGWDPGYNSVLINYGEYVRELARRSGFESIDLNAPVVDALVKAKITNPDLSQKIIPGRIHPSAAGHLMMAWNVAKAWGVDPVVSEVSVDTAAGAARTTNAEVKNVKSSGEVTWDEMEGSLPFPIDLSDPTVKLVVDTSSLEEQMNKETLSVLGLKPGNYQLLIDGKPCGSFADTQLAGGVNLATLDTPMTRQAAAVSDLVWKEAGLRMTNWRNIEFPLLSLKSHAKEEAMDSINRLVDDLVNREYAESRPDWHHYQVRQVN